MAKNAFTLRMGTEERNALKSLSKIVKRPINQLIVEAIQSYIHQRGQEEQKLEAHLANLKAYRKKDPGFARAIAAFSEAEVSLEDPLEGEPFKEETAAEPLKPGKSTEAKVREILGS
jgi:predicted DNA-binding protein